MTILKLPEIIKNATPYQSFKNKLIQQSCRPATKKREKKKIKVKLKLHNNHTSQDICQKDNVITA